MTSASSLFSVAGTTDGTDAVIPRLPSGPIRRLGSSLASIESPSSVAKAIWFPVETATGGSTVLVLLVFVSLFVATGLSLYLAIRLYRGYRAGGTTDMLLLGIGLVLLTTIPMLCRLILSNVPVVEPAWRETIATTAQLLGLLVILGVIYGRR